MNDSIGNDFDPSGGNGMKAFETQASSNFTSPWSASDTLRAASGDVSRKSMICFLDF